MFLGILRSETLKDWKKLNFSNFSIFRNFYAGQLNLLLKKILISQLWILAILAILGILTKCRTQLMSNNTTRSDNWEFWWFWCFWKFYVVLYSKGWANLNFSNFSILRNFYAGQLNFLLKKGFWILWILAIFETFTKSISSWQTVYQLVLNLGNFKNFWNFYKSLKSINVRQHNKIGKLRILWGEGDGKNSLNLFSLIFFNTHKKAWNRNRHIVPEGNLGT